MKTSLQELIEYQENQYRLWVDNGSVNENEGIIMLSFINKTKSLLEKEKQDLIEAHFEGQKECSNEFAMESDARLYFKQTFEQ